MSYFRVPSVLAFATTALLVLGAPVLARAQCGSWPSAMNPVPGGGSVIDVTPAEVGSLQSILSGAQPGDTIQLSDGLYELPETLVFATPGVTLRSKSGNRFGVVLDGRYAIGDVLLLMGSDITIADLTLTHSYWHLVHVVPGGGPIFGITLHNLRGIDAGEQFIKVNPANGQYADNGVIRCSSLELTDAGRLQIRNGCYTGGIDIHQARGWQIYANMFNGFWCDSGLSEHAIHVWTGSRDTVVDRNVIVNSARGIGFGLGASGVGRTYSDLPCNGLAYVGHFGGVITNNFVAVNDPRLWASPNGFDTGIGLEQSCETNVLHNTVVSIADPRSSSIEWRFPNTVAIIANNLVTHNLLARDGATGELAGNLTYAPLSMFVDAAGGNLHLVAGATAAIDQAAVLLTPMLSDIDAEARWSLPDIGADEYTGQGGTFTIAGPMIAPPAGTGAMQPPRR